jgi:hypothetical protein
MVEFFIHMFRDDLYTYHGEKGSPGPGSAFFANGRTK